MNNFIKKVFNKILLFSVFACISFNNTFAEEMGYFDIQNGSEYLGFSNMNKEFKITSLMNSAIANDAKAAKIFIASGANIEEKNIAGATALHLASRNNSFETAQVLIENGAKVNERDFEGWTPLMRASLSGNKEIMELLIDQGANMWAQNNYGETPLLHTAMANCYECGKLILEKTSEYGIDNYLINKQIEKSLQIVNKRYNEPFIDLLNKNLNKKHLLVFKSSNSVYDTINTDTDTNKNTNIKRKKYIINDEMEVGDITQLVYVFTGKTISKKEINEIGKNIYKLSTKKENIDEINEKNNAKKYLFLENNRDIINDNENNIKYTFKQQEIKDDKNNIVKYNFKQEEIKNDVDSNIKYTFKQEKVEEDQKNTIKYKFNQDLSKQIIEEVENENTEEENQNYVFNGSEMYINKIVSEDKIINLDEKDKNKEIYKLDSTLSKPVIEEDFDKNSTIIDNNKKTKFKLKNDEKSYKFSLNEIESRNENDENDEMEKVYKIKSLDKQKFSFNSSIKEKKTNMKLINNNDKLNPDYIEYNLQSDENYLNK